MRKIQVAGYLGAEPKTVYEIASEVYPEVKAYDVFLAVSEVVAHPDLVVEDGDAVAEAGENDVVFYRSAAASGRYRLPRFGTVACCSKHPLSK